MRKLFFTSVFFLPVLCFSQQKKYDSLLVSLKHSAQDTNRVLTLMSITNNSRSNEEGMAFACEGLDLSEKLNFERGKIRATHHIANIFFNQGDYSKALQHYLKEQKILEATGKTKLIGGVYIGMGNVYAAQNNLDKSLEYYQMALTAIRALDDSQKSSTIVALNNIGSIYQEQKKYKEALDYYAQVLKINEEEGHDPYSMGSAYSSIGSIYTALNNYDEALWYFKKGLSEFKKIDMRQRISGSQNEIGELYVKTEKYREAVDCFTRALKLIEGTRVLEVAMRSHEGLAQAFAGLGDFKNAYEEHKKFSDLKDTLLNEENSQQMNEMATKYETEKKDKELIKKDAEITKQNAQSSQRATERNAFIIGFALMIALAVFIFRSYRQKQTANVAISKQKEIIEEKQKEILDSIHYAKRIQQSLLPTEKYIERSLKRLMKK